jgi:hypothetical protein
MDLPMIPCYLLDERREKKGLRGCHVTYRRGLLLGGIKFTTKVSYLRKPEEEEEASHMRPKIFLRKSSTPIFGNV